MVSFSRLRSRRRGEPQGEKDAAWYDRTFQENPHWRDHYTKSKYYFIWCVIADRLGRQGARTVLDIGCGSGQLATLLCDKGARGHGLDFSEQRIACARSMCPSWAFTACDAFATDLIRDAPYDAVITTEFLEHVEGDTAILEQIRSGTFVLATVPNFPFASHVRHFSSAAEVVARYAPLFDNLRVDWFFGNDRGQIYYLLEGVKS